MVRTCVEERCWVYREQGAEDGAARQEEMSSLKDVVEGSRLRRFRHAWRRGAGYIGNRVLKVELPGKRK